MFITAFVAAFIFIITGNFLDLRIERTNVDMYRAAADFMNYLSASSPLLMNDSGGNLLKSAVNFTRVDASNPKGAWDNQRWYGSGCCRLNGFDYIYSAHGLSGTGVNFSDVRTDGSDPGRYFPYFNPRSPCYQLAGLMKSNSIDSMVDLCYDRNNCTLGKEELTITKTPLSEMTYWLSRACVSGEQNFTKLLLFDTGDVNRVELDTARNEVCVYFNAGLQKVCKSYSCTGAGAYARTQGDLTSDEVRELQSPVQSASCFGVIIKQENGRTYFDNIFSSLRPSYTWASPSSCSACVVSCSSYSNGDAISSIDTPVIPLLPGKCRPSLQDDVGSDVVNYGGDQNNWYSRSDGGKNQVSSVSVNGHGYIWAPGRLTYVDPAANGYYRYSAECCSGGNCYGKTSGSRVHSTNVLSTDSIDTVDYSDERGNVVISGGDKKTFVDMFNSAWCGFPGKDCLLCAPDQGDSGRTKWYVCNGGKENYGPDSGVQEVEPGKNIGGYACGLYGWK